MCKSYKVKVKITKPKLSVLYFKKRFTTVISQISLRFNSRELQRIFQSINKVDSIRLIHLMSTTDNMTRKELPKKLEDDLNNVKYCKYTTEKNINNSNNERTSQKLTKFFDDSIEKTMYDEVFGPLLNRGIYII